jgi:hypothetical protein
VVKDARKKGQYVNVIPNIMSKRHRSVPRQRKRVQMSIETNQNEDNVYSNVHMAPMTHAPTKLPTPTNLAFCSARSPVLQPSELFASAGKIVANGAVGFGGPDTVTVGAPARGEGVDESGVVDDETIENRGDTV